MPGVVRMSDVDSKGVATCTASPNTFAENLGTARFNDLSSARKIGRHTVVVNNLDIQVIGDGISNGATSIAGSSTVFADGG